VDGAKSDVDGMKFDMDANVNGRAGVERCEPQSEVTVESQTEVGAQLMGVSEEGSVDIDIHMANTASEHRQEQNHQAISNNSNSESEEKIGHGKTEGSHMMGSPAKPRSQASVDIS
jgi:hypothetical protein